MQIWLGHNNYTVTGGTAYYDDIRVSGRLPYMVHDGMIGTPIAEFIRLVKQTPDLQAAYLTKANSYQTFLENEIVPRWENSSYIGNTWKSLSSTTGIYTYPTNLQELTKTLSGTHLPYNMALAYATMLSVLHDVNGNPTYLDRAKKVNQYFKNSLIANGTAYKWYYQDATGSNMEDTSHANIDLASVLEMYKKGLVYTGTDMEKFTDTLTEYLWNGSITSPLLNKYVDGTPIPINTAYTKLMMSWADLAWFDKSVWSIAAEQFHPITPDKSSDFLTLSRIMRWDPAKLVNQGFELATSFDSTQPAQWVRQGSTSSTAYLDSTNRYDGKYGATIAGNGTSWQYLVQTWREWKPSVSYTLSFYGKTDGTAAGGRVIVKNETTGLSLANYTFTNTSWTNHSVTFTAPANTTDVVKVYLGNQTYTVSNGKAYFDTIKTKATSDSW